VVENATPLGTSKSKGKKNTTKKHSDADIGATAAPKVKRTKAVGNKPFRRNKDTAPKEPPMSSRYYTQYFQVFLFLSLAHATFSNRHVLILDFIFFISPLEISLSSLGRTREVIQEVTIAIHPPSAWSTQYIPSSPSQPASSPPNPFPLPSANIVFPLLRSLEVEALSVVREETMTPDDTHLHGGAIGSAPEQEPSHGTGIVGTNIEDVTAKTDSAAHIGASPDITSLAPKRSASFKSTTPPPDFGKVPDPSP
jgi:hypothetical protein